MRLQAGEGAAGPPAPAWLTGEPCIAGIDEAGRGPVLGPMVYGVAVAPASGEAGLKSRRAASLQRGPHPVLNTKEALRPPRGFADSKALTEARRDALYAELEADETVAFQTASATARTISAAMLSPDKVSLNALANDMTFGLLDSLIARGVQLAQVYVDTVGDAGFYQAKLSKRYPDIRFTVCPKADALYPIVSAASIAAKVTRDRELQSSFPAAESTAYGSGYPGDPVTKAWLEGHAEPVFGFGEVVRFSWAPAISLLEARGVAVRWPEEEEEGMVAGQQRLSFGPGPAAGGSKEAASPSKLKASQGTGRHSFFRSRKLQKWRPGPRRAAAVT